MNTRQFIKSVILASVAPSILIPKAIDHMRWKRRGDWILNPAYEDAPMEVWYFDSRMYSEKDFCGKWTFDFPPKRYILDGKAGLFVSEVIV